MSWIMNPDGTGIPRNAQDDQEEKVGATKSHIWSSAHLNMVYIFVRWKTTLVVKSRTEQQISRFSRMWTTYC